MSVNGNQPDEFVRGYIVEIVPEPSTSILFGMGAIGLIVHVLRKGSRTLN
ncbi:MAG: PEP-CTERM sorting domain-containing protein [Verrucomicrobiota bacterium]|jgi:hypothetical protein